MNKYAVCIGINDYPGTGNDLAGCVNDANDWAQTLTGRGFEATTLLDSQAIGENILGAISGAVGRAQYGDTVVITYSGHGSYVPDADGDEADGRDEVWCPHDLFSRGPLTDDQLHRALDARKFGAKVIVMSDSCFSGTVLRFAGPVAPTDQRRSVRFLPPSEFLSGNQQRAAERLIAAPRSARWRSAALLMSGCTDAEYSYDAWFGNRPNGAFTRVALDAFRALSPDATYRDWFRAVRRALPSTDYPQSPQLEGSVTQRFWKIP